MELAHIKRLHFFASLLAANEHHRGHVAGQEERRYSEVGAYFEAMPEQFPLNSANIATAYLENILNHFGGWVALVVLILNYCTWFIA